MKAHNTLIVAASRREAESLKDYFAQAGPASKLKIPVLVTGVGSVNTLWSIMDYLAKNPAPSLILNIGIAGSYKREIKLGELVLVSDDCFGDLGVEDGENFSTVFEAGLAGSNEYPFVDGKLYPDNTLLNMLKEEYRAVSGITVNKVTGSRVSMERMKKKFNADIESMESAAVYYVAARENIPAIGIRSVSNYVEARDRDKWDIDLALSRLGSALTNILNKLYH
ncbi:MAG: futalosine hydrolase [Marinilabiliaceae bacterium]|nr:futalosine hydrolase [Marinilabiliaceae bacterium]